MLNALTSKGYSMSKLSLGRIDVDGTTIKARKGGWLNTMDIEQVKDAKVHAVIWPEALPLSVQVGSGCKHNPKHLIKLLEGVRVKHGRGRAMSRPGEVTGDSAYDASCSQMKGRPYGTPLKGA